MSSILDKTCGENEKVIVVQRRCLELPFKIFGTTISTPISTHDSAHKYSRNCELSIALGDQGAPFEIGGVGDDSQEKKANTGRMEADEGSCTGVKIKSTSSGTSDRKVSSMIPKKKPDYRGKVLPCPRCDSLETKFCYYNNYNVKQPRHFCKNCQRYWTAGGTLRNVPVGAGRRKNKHNSDTHINNNSTHEGNCTFRNDYSNIHYAQSLNSYFSIPIPAIQSAFSSSLLSFGLENYNSNFSGRRTKVLYHTSNLAGQQIASPTSVSENKETLPENEGNWQINLNANSEYNQ